jgi:hypothetical protein
MTMKTTSGGVASRPATDEDVGLLPPVVDTRMVARDDRFAFVRGFGIDPTLLIEIHVYSVAGSLGDLPPSVQDLLAKLHQRGCAVGDRIVQFLFHDRRLEPGEAIYVAISRATARTASRAVAFMDRDHRC